MHGMSSLPLVEMSGFAGPLQLKNLKQEKIILSDCVLILLKVNEGHVAGQGAHIARQTEIDTGFPKDRHL